MIRRHGWRLAAAVSVLLLAVLAWHWSPARQARLHQKNFLLAVENRKWERVDEFIATDYRDRWRQSRAQLRERLPMVFRDFLALGIVAGETETARSGGDVLVRSRLSIVGSGGPIAQFVMNEAETLTAPFVFTWWRASWKPWDWALASVDQPELEVPADAEL